MLQLTIDVPLTILGAFVAAQTFASIGMVLKSESSPAVVGRTIGGLVVLGPVIWAFLMVAGR